MCVWQWVRVVSGTIGSTSCVGVEEHSYFRLWAGQVVVLHSVKGGPTPDLYTVGGEGGAAFNVGVAS